MAEEQNNIQQQQLPQQTFKIRGMKHDSSESSFENSYAYENKNIRLNIVDEDNTLLNLTNERGTKKCGSILGIPIGVKQYSTNKALVITTQNIGGEDIPELKYESADNISTLQYSSVETNISAFNDYIYKVDDIGEGVRATKIVTKANTQTNFCAQSPVEIEHYKDGESDYFYLADGKNNFKTLKLKNDSVVESTDNLDYNVQINGDELILAFPKQSSNGEFYSGAIVYCFCYVTKQGHKTGIIDVSEVYYLTDYELGYGLEPNKRCNIMMYINVKNLRYNKFAAVEVYSLYRSSLNGEIVTRKVCKSNLTSSNMAVITDYNKGELWSYQELLSRFNSVLIPSTLTQKSSALFLGNIKTNNYTSLKSLISKTSSNITLTSTNDDFLKYNQYFYGIQLQDIYGNWSPVIYVGENSDINKITISGTFCKAAIQNGYIAVRAMMLDNVRVHNIIAEGVTSPSWGLDNSKYGIKYYSPYFHNVSTDDIYNGVNRISINLYSVTDFYSPDIEFDENFMINTNSTYALNFKNLTATLSSHKCSININGNTGILYNNESTKLGSVTILNNSKYLWKDAISGYQKALQLLIAGYGGSYTDDDVGTDIVTSLYNLGRTGIREYPTNYVIYVWQPSGSLNDSNGQSSVLRTKKISRKYIFSKNGSYVTQGNIKCRIFDGTTNNIPVKGSEVYAGIVNQKVYSSTWSIDEKLRDANTVGNDHFWDDNQASIGDEYALAILNTYKYIGQPIEYYYPNSLYHLPKDIFKCADFPALLKVVNENSNIKNNSNVEIRLFRGTRGLSIGYIQIPQIFSNESKYYAFNWNNEINGMEFGWSDSGYSQSTNGKTRTSSSFKKLSTLKIRVSNKYNRSGSINLAYKTAKHLVLTNTTGTVINGGYCQLKNSSNISYTINDKDIENGQWIVVSRKVKLQDSNISLTVKTNEKYTWTPYECLKTEPYSLSDENQVTCCYSVNGVSSYINPMCRYDNLRGLSDYNDITSAVFNKMNMVYNQKNNFFIFSGITKNTVTDDSLENTIIYSDMKVNNEQEDSFINFSNTNFYTIDSNITKINKLITYNDKLLCFGDSSILQILYNENVVINTDSVQSLGLASTDRITGSQLLSNTYGCLNKWSIGIYSDTLYFNDDLSNKIMAYNGDFVALNESLGIETLNSKLLKKSEWNPITWSNTKLNIDNYGKDVHYTGSDIDIALNPFMGAFTSLYDYDNIPYFVNVDTHILAFQPTISSRNTNIWALREGRYNYFFDTFKPYWTTVIMNQNSLVNKMLSNVEFSTEAYDDINLPLHNFTFDHISYWNDYQSNSMEINYKLYGISMLKKKFRIWRVNRFRNETRLLKRQYDMMSNPWHYMKLSTEIPNENKVTLHWININYR